MFTGTVVACGLIGLAPATALADPAGPTDYRTVVTSIQPATGAIAVTVEGGDAFIRLAVEPGHEVVVLGYGGEPYVRVRADGVVEENLLSPATYYNEARYGGAVPSGITATGALEQPPEWKAVGDGGVWAWHDHRAHLMTAEPLIGMQPGDRLPPETIDLLVDGEPVAVEVVTTLQASPSRWPAVVGLAIGIGVVASLVFVSRLAIRQHAAPTVAVAVAAAAASVVVGGVQYLSLSSQTDPAVTWWLLPVMALLASAGAAAVRSALVRGALVALGGLQLLVWAVPRRSVLSRAVLPTDLPFWLDRTVTAAVLPGAAALLVVGLIEMFSPVPHRAT
ncbi:MAG TPA: hypothetical protein VMM60_06060 [Ilumatobacter sp.]|nr:hypothetical protein [Ilumatobacter sp.]